MGCVNCSGAASSKGNKGDQGVTGSQGLFGGFSGDWLFSTSTSTGPAVTQLRFDNAAPASVTNIYVSDTNASSIDYDAFLDSLSNNSQYGLIRIFKKTDNTKFWMGKVTAVTDNGADHTIAVTYITSNSTFAASDPVVLTFSPGGAGGSGGLIVLSNNQTPVASSSNILADLMTYTIPANTLKADGDVIEITALFDCINLFTLSKSIALKLGGTIAHNKVGFFILGGGEIYLDLKVVITRQSATTVFIQYLSNTAGALYALSGGNAFYETAFSVSNLVSNSLVVLLQGKVAVGPPSETITQRQLLVKYFNKS